MAAHGLGGLVCYTCSMRTCAECHSGGVPSAFGRVAVQAAVTPATHVPLLDDRRSVIILHLAARRVGASNAAAGHGVRRATEPEGFLCSSQERGEAAEKPQPRGERRRIEERKTAGRAWRRPEGGASTSTREAVQCVCVSILSMPNIV
jgi:hypothetical protein